MNHDSTNKINKRMKSVLKESRIDIKAIKKKDKGKTGKICYWLTNPRTDFLKNKNSNKTSNKEDNIYVSYINIRYILCYI